MKYTNRRNRDDNGSELGLGYLKNVTGMVVLSGTEAGGPGAHPKSGEIRRRRKAAGSFV